MRDAGDPRTSFYRYRHGDASNAGDQANNAEIAIGETAPRPSSCEIAGDLEDPLDGAMFKCPEPRGMRERA